MSVLIAPSLLTADFLNLGREVEMVNISDADWFHIDIMDGHFAPNFSFGFAIIEKIKSVARKPLDVHLMITDPDRYIDRFHNSGADLISIHYEACRHLHRSVEMIHNTGCRAGVVLNPHTPVNLLEEILPETDYVLLMSVNPGYGGQKFIPGTYEKVRKLKEMIIRNGTSTLIEIDGGVDLHNASKLIEAGADILVAGNTVFSSVNPLQTIHALKTS